MEADLRASTHAGEALLLVVQAKAAAGVQTGVGAVNLGSTRA